MAIETEIVGRSAFPIRIVPDTETNTDHAGAYVGRPAAGPRLLPDLSEPDDQAPARAAFDHLLTDAIPRLYRLALRMGASPYDARDLVQDTVERALKRHRDFTIGTNIEAWLATIMRRIHIDGYRRSRRFADPVQSAELAAPEPDDCDPVAAVDEEDVWVAVERLPPLYRKAYLLFAAQGRSYREIATDLGISPRTVGTRILRARRQLRRILAPALA
jgi:RNA polymerase sigma-70 factor (ECF subfamily)